MKLAIFIALIVCAVGVHSQCWWSGCQPNTWAERGCFPSSDWHQTSSQSCSNGDMFYCCPGGSPTTPVQAQGKNLKKRSNLI